MSEDYRFHRKNNSMVIRLQMSEKLKELHDAKSADLELLKRVKDLIVRVLI